jgi:hypothetical protein
MKYYFALLASVALPAYAHHEGHAHSLAASVRHAPLSYGQLLAVVSSVLAVAGLCFLLGVARAWRCERDRRRQLRMQTLVPFVGRSHGGHVG